MTYFNVFACFTRRVDSHGDRHSSDSSRSDDDSDVDAATSMLQPDSFASTVANTAKKFGLTVVDPNLSDSNQAKEKGLCVRV